MKEKSLIIMAVSLSLTLLLVRFSIYAIAFSYYMELLSYIDLLFYILPMGIVLFLDFVFMKEELPNFKGREKKIVMMTLTIFLVVSFIISMYWIEEEKWKYPHSTANLSFYRDTDQYLLDEMHIFSVFVDGKEYLCLFSGGWGVEIRGKITDYKAFEKEYKGEKYLSHNFFYDNITDEVEYEKVYNKLKNIGWEDESVQEALYLSTVIQTWEEYHENKR